MKKVYDYWFPEGETHLTEMLNKNFKNENIAEYQFAARSESLKFPKNFRVAVDIGANVGLWARELSERFDQVVAFEPISEFVDCLKLNVNKDNLTVMNYGLGDKTTTADFVITENNMGSTHIDPNSIGNGKFEIKTLDSFELPIVDYMKLDCEGFEYRVLQGAEKTILRCKPIIVVEQKAHKYFASEYNQTDGVKLLQSWGMVVLSRVRKDFILGWN